MKKIKRLLLIVCALAIMMLAACGAHQYDGKYVATNKNTGETMTIELSGYSYNLLGQNAIGCVKLSNVYGINSRYYGRWLDAGADKNGFKIYADDYADLKWVGTYNKDAKTITLKGYTYKLKK